MKAEGENSNISVAWRKWRNNENWRIEKRHQWRHGSQCESGVINISSVISSI